MYALEFSQFSDIEIQGKSCSMLKVTGNKWRSKIGTRCYDSKLSFLPTIVLKPKF